MYFFVYIENIDIFLSIYWTCRYCWKDIAISNISIYFSRYIRHDILNISYWTYRYCWKNIATNQNFIVIFYPKLETRIFPLLRLFLIVFILHDSTRCFIGFSTSWLLLLFYMYVVFACAFV